MDRFADNAINHPGGFFSFLILIYAWENKIELTILIIFIQGSDMKAEERTRHVRIQ